MERKDGRASGLGAVESQYMLQRDSSRIAYLEKDLDHDGWFVCLEVVKSGELRTLSPARRADLTRQG
jgi:hypothetical protein